MELRVIRNLSLLACLGALLILGGCGGGDDGESDTLPKAAYVKKADEICAKTEKRQRKLLTQFQKENPKLSPEERPVVEKMIAFAALPPMEQQIKELSELPAPEKEAAKAEAYVKALEKGIAATEDQPGALLEQPGAFTKAEEAAADFGYKTCLGP